jgi:hypothetical protein
MHPEIAGDVGQQRSDNETFLKRDDGKNGWVSHG